MTSVYPCLTGHFTLPHSGTNEVAAPLARGGRVVEAWGDQFFLVSAGAAMDGLQIFLIGLAGIVHRALFGLRLIGLPSTGALAISLVHRSWNTTRPSGV